MPHNACTIILNGHGGYIADNIINMSSCPNDYSVFFPCRHRESITISHHNLILANLATCQNDRITTRLEMMEAPLTVTVLSKEFPALFSTNMSAARHTSILYDHVLSNASDVVGAHTLENTNGAKVLPEQKIGGIVQHHSGGRFESTELIIIDDPSISRNWGNGKLQIEFDIEDVHANVLQNFDHESSVLKETQLMSMRVKAPDGERANFLLSDLIETIIPKIKIFASKHTDGTFDVLREVFLDDRNDSAENLAMCAASSAIFQHPGDKLHELTIAGDANIVWDACRDLAT